MRTTLSLDDEIVVFARAHAQREHISLGEAVSRLARQGIAAQWQPRRLFSPDIALRPAALRGEVVTSEHVRALMEQEGI